MLSIFQRRKPEVQPLFAPHTLTMSETVQWLASKCLIDPMPYVQRHVRGDRGDLDEAEHDDDQLSQDQYVPRSSYFQITPHLCLVVTTRIDQERFTTVVRLREERALP